MKYPHKVRITGKINYLIVWVDKFDDPNQGGACDSDTKTIYLCRNMSAQRTREVFWHEVIHAVEFEYQVPVPHSIIQMLEEAFPKLINLNPVMFRRGNA